MYEVVLLSNFLRQLRVCLCCVCCVTEINSYFSSRLISQTTALWLVSVGKLRAADWCAEDCESEITPRACFVVYLLLGVFSCERPITKRNRVTQNSYKSNFNFWTKYFILIKSVNLFSSCNYLFSISKNNWLVRRLSFKLVCKF